MGYALITANKMEGLYDINIKRDISRCTARVGALTARIAVLDEKIAAEQSATVKAGLKLQRNALAREKTTIQAIPEYIARSNVWCADYRENLTGVVPTLEINGESDIILLAPGGAATGLGILQPAGASTPAGCFRNLALLPCWQKYRPNYRIAHVTAVDEDNDLLDIIVYAAYSSQQGLPINQGGTSVVAEKDATSGYLQFASANPSDPLVTNTNDTTVTLTPSMLQSLRDVNNEINNNNSYKRDIDQYGALEHWAYLSPGGAGDCEDFALTKAQRLQAEGFPVGALKLEVGLTSAGLGHAWLTVTTDKGDYSLDINYRDVIPSSQMNYKRTGRLVGGQWGLPGIAMTGVPVEYLT